MRSPLHIDESSVAFQVAGQQLLGVMARPGIGSFTGTGIVVVAGGAQSRVGANRRFVDLARALAVAGHAVLRFDQRGLGDSDGDPCGFESASDDITAAAQALREACPTLRKVVLLGLCDGASASVLALARLKPELRPSALVLINPWVHSPVLAAQARVQHHYRRRLADPQWWKRLVSGQVRPAAWFAGLAALWRSRRAAPALDFVERMNAHLQTFEGAVLVVLSGRDQTAQEFDQLLATHPRWTGLASRPNWHTVRHADADHTHTGEAAGHHLMNDVIEWLRVQPCETSA